MYGQGKESSSFLKEDGNIYMYTLKQKTSVKSCCTDDIETVEMSVFIFLNTVDSRYLEVEGTIRNISRYPYFDISDFQN